MALGVYSARLYAGWLQATIGVEFRLFTVPDGETVIVDSVHADQTSGTGSTLYLAVNSAGPIVARYVPSAAGVIDEVRQHLIFHSLETCYAIVQGQAARGALHGYILQGSRPPLVLPLSPQPPNTWD